MKKLLIVAAISAVSLTSFAQEEVTSYNLVGVSYDLTSVSANKDQKPFGLDGKSSAPLSGFGIEYTHGFGLGSNMFIEGGLKFNMGFKKYSKEKVDLNYSFSRLSIPVSYAYRFNCGDKLAFTPYAGLDFRFNLTGQSKLSYGDEKETQNWFKKDDTDPTFKRFQMGWHIGVRAEYSRIFANVNFGTDFLPAWKYEKYKYSTLNFTFGLGYRF